MIRAPVVPIAFVPIAFDSNLANPAISTENRQSLFICKESLIVLQFHVRHSLKKPSKKEFVTPEERVSRVSAMACLLMVSDHLVVCLVAGECVLSTAIRLELQKPI